jgi:hypothetical protein
MTTCIASLGAVGGGVTLSSGDAAVALSGVSRSGGHAR